jgi:hypothetical protein
MNKKLQFNSGQGYGDSEENGRFIVKHSDKETEFDKLSEAREFYDSINEEKAIWDMTKIPELLECHSYFE